MAVSDVGDGAVGPLPDRRMRRRGVADPEEQEREGRGICAAENVAYPHQQVTALGGSGQDQRTYPEVGTGRHRRRGIAKRSPARGQQSLLVESRAWKAGGSDNDPGNRILGERRDPGATRIGRR